MIKAEKRWLDIPAVILFLIALWLVSTRLITTNWTSNLSLVQYALLLASVIGMALGYSLFSTRTVRWLGIAYSGIIITWFFSKLLPDEIVWAEKMIRLSQGLKLSIGEFIRNEPVQGSLLFMVFMIFAFWWIGISAGYQLTRHGMPWVPLLVLFISYLIIEYYPPMVKARHFLSALTVLFLLMLLGRLYFARLQARWNEKGALIDFGTGFDVSRSMAIAGLILVVIAWGIPGIVSILTPGTTQQQKFVEFWKPLQERLANAVLDLRSPRTVNYDFYSRSLGLGTEISVDDTPVFFVEVSSPRAHGFKYYWHGYAYDLYEDGTWKNSIEEFQTIKPSDWPQPLPEWEARQRVKVSVFWQYQRSRLIYLPSSPILLSRPIQWYATETPDGLDGAAIIANTSVYADEVYKAETLVSSPTINQLLETGEAYPDWVTERYLQLPVDLPPSIPQLAQEITVGLQTPYEKTAAITEYLRENIEYAEVVEPAPDLADPLEWFLFHSRQGFCNYYATAEVILLRSLGIPARMVVGFAQGEPVEGADQYLVRVNDGHAWPEVFFPGLGWIEFEPTVAYEPMNLVYADSSLYDPNSMGIYEDGREIRRDLTESFFLNKDIFSENLYGFYGPSPRVYYPLREWGIFLGVIVLLGVLFWLQGFQFLGVRSQPATIQIKNLMRKWGWEIPGWLQFLAYRSSLSPIERYFSEISWISRMLGVSTSSAFTPVEQVDLLLQRLPLAEKEAKALLNEYQLSIYSSHQGDLEKARFAHSRLWMKAISAAMKRQIGK